MLQRAGWLINALAFGLALEINAQAEDEKLADLLKTEEFVSVKVRHIFDDSRIVVPVKINGKELRLLIDTGAPYTLISRQSAERLGITIQQDIGAARGTNGLADEKAGLAKIDSFRIGDVETNPAPVVISNFQFTYLFGNEYDGLLGLATLKANNVVFTYEPSTFHLNTLRPVTYRMSSRLLEKGYVEIPLRHDRGRYLLSLGISGVTANGILDTGAQATVVNLDFAEQNHLPLGPQKLRSNGMDGKSTAVRALMPTRLSIAMRILPPMQIAAARLDVFQRKDMTSQGAIDAMIAYDVMMRYEPVFDFGNDRLYLRLPDGTNPP